MKPAAAVVAFLACAWLGFADAAPPAVQLVPAGTGFSLPVDIASPRDGSGRLFVVQQGGRIRILLNGAIHPTPFLDLSTGGIISTGGERGLLGLAFHPDYAANRAFYVYYTKAGTGALTIARVLRSASNPDVADAASRVEILEIAHIEQTNHNGGKLAFGPDGYL